jgi:hypothetical protein
LFKCDKTIFSQGNRHLHVPAQIIFCPTGVLKGFRKVSVTKVNMGSGGKLHVFRMNILKLK